MSGEIRRVQSAQSLANQMIELFTQAIQRVVQSAGSASLELPYFTGDPLENGLDFLSMFRHAQAIEEWAPHRALMLFCSHVTGSARDYMRSKFGNDFIIPPRDEAKEKLDHMITFFANKYCTAEAQRKRIWTLFRLRQHDNESCKNFLNRVIETCAKAGESAHAYEVLMAGLRDNIGQELKSIYGIFTIEQLQERGDYIWTVFESSPRNDGNRRHDNNFRGNKFRNNDDRRNNDRRNNDRGNNNDGYRNNDGGQNNQGQRNEGRGYNNRRNNNRKIGAHEATIRSATTKNQNDRN